MKKITIALLLFPLLFSLASLIIPQKAHAANYRLNVATLVDDNGNSDYNINGRRDGDSCYNGSFTVQVTDASGTRTLTKTSQTSCSGSILEIPITLKPNDPDLYELGEDYYRVKITAPNRTLNYTHIFYDNPSSSPVTKKGTTTSFDITRGDRSVQFGLRSYCDENVSTNCIKCTSNSQCSSNPNFKYCAPTTDKCSDLTTYKNSLCNANNYCGTFTVGGTSLACGGCGTDKTCNTDTHKCSIIPNCTAGAKLGTCKAKNSIPKPDGGTCGPGSGTQTKTLTTKPNYTDCREVATTQDCSAPESQVCRSGNCNSSNECAPISSTKTLSFTGYVFIDNGAGGGTANDGKKNGTEALFTSPYTVQAAGDASTKNGNNYSVTTKTNANKITVKLLIPSGYASTKLNYLIPSENITNNPTADGANIDLGASGTVHFGIKKIETQPAATRDLVVSAFTFPGGVDTGTSDPIVKIKNIGNAQITGDFQVKVINRDGGATKTWTVTQVVSPNEEIPLSSHFTNMPRPNAGDYIASVFVDSVGNISESNEGNNFQTDAYKTTKPSGGGSGGGGTDPTPDPAPTCVKNRPTLDVKPNSRSGNAGDKKDFTIEIKNNDTAQCDNATFDISKIGVIGWDSTLEKDSLDIAPGNTKSTTMSVSSPNNAENGPATFTVNIQRTNGPLISENVTYDVQAIDPTISQDPVISNDPVISQDPTISEEPVISNPPTITSIPGQTNLNLIIGIDGIGTTARTPIGGNKNPERANRNLTVRMYNAASNTPADVFQDHTVTYNPASGKFEGALSFGDNFQSGIYNVYVEGPQVLRGQLPGSVTLTRGMNKTAQTLDMITGDINKIDRSNNNLDLNDYNILVSCSIYSQDRSACDVNPNYQTYADLDDNGIVDEDDFTLWLKEVANQGGSQLPL